MKIGCNNPKGCERWKCDSYITLKIINQKNLADSKAIVKQHSFDKDNGAVVFNRIKEIGADLYADGFLKVKIINKVFNL